MSLTNLTREGKRERERERERDSEKDRLAYEQTETDKRTDKIYLT